MPKRRTRCLPREIKRERSLARRTREKRTFEFNWPIAEENDRSLRAENPNWSPPEPAWRSLPRAPDEYEVHYFGFVRSKPRQVTQRTHSGTTYTRAVGGKILTTRNERDPRGRKRMRKLVTLKIDGNARPASVAELVLEAFNSPRCGREIRYKDGDRSNCHILNLEWSALTQSDLLISRNFPKLAKRVGIPEDRLAHLRKRDRRHRRSLERTPGTKEYYAKRKFERELKEEIDESFWTTEPET